MTALAIFVKSAALSPVKTRLAASLGACRAVAFHRLAARACGAVAVACAPEPSALWAVAEPEGLRQAEWQGLPRLWQGEGGLGERLHSVYAALQARHGQVLLIGSDAPQITSALLRQAAHMLSAGPDPFVMGRALDGGFWLFGGRVPVPAAAWASVPYSRPDTAERLAGALSALGGIGALPCLRDVDEAADLPALAAALDALPDPLPEQAALRHWIAALPGPAGGGRQREFA